ncbi:N-acyl homoserine lactonase family protein [Oceaniserpentilla sp. 4NH20-0058]|uniref:N-acyl homoserine lactonase family protein n=1 Tax=Oceaniserpentilla sp. 4NH20-0058 TaxID=3127660 RepID=UPI00310BE4B5
MKTPILLLIALLAFPTIGFAKPNLTLHVFECGNIEVRDISMFSPGIDKGVTKELTNSCYLIRHEKGTMIWDTGFIDAIGENGAEGFGGMIKMTVTNPLSKQLAEININPADIDYIGISHFHGDHTGNTNLFSNAALLIQQAEYNAAFGPAPEKFGFNPPSYAQLDKSKFKILNGDHDVFGDGNVVIKSAPGHTPGHQMLYINLPESGPIVLSGDLYHFTKNRTHKRVPSFNFNKEQTLVAMEAIENFVKDENAQFWIQHDKEQNATIKHSPEFYK